MAAMNLNLEQFHKTVVENKGTALVEFWAPWCVYCRRIGPAYDKIAQQYQEALSVAEGQHRRGAGPCPAGAD